MEEILASIRRIIADDQMLPLTRGNAAPSVAAPEPAERQDAMAALEAMAAPLAPPRVEAPAPRAEAPAPEPQAPRIASPRVEAPAAFRAEAPAALRAETPVAPRPVVDVAIPRARLEPAAQARAPARAEPQAETSPLLSPEPGATVSSAFHALATTMVLQNQGMIEDATREMLRPMLKQWLDDNLPTMVERLVRQEIERVARGGR